MKNITLTTIQFKKTYLLLVLFSLSGILSYGFQSTINCSTVAEIKTAMQNAVPGDEIVIMPGAYAPSTTTSDAIGKSVRFTSDQNGTAANPIILRGSSPTNKPLLKCPDSDIYNGAVMSITGDYWILKDFEVVQGAKGIMLDGANFCVLDNLDVYNVADEAIHIRSGSSDNLIKNCNISNTGVVQPQFGEGIYIGSDRAQHSTYDPNCNRNVVEFCTLGPDVRAEHFDIKEGTEYNEIRNCTMDATGITGANFSDSFIDVKGIYTFIYNNTFDVNEAPALNSIIDFNNRTNSSYSYKTGEKVSIFNNIMNLGSRIELPTATSRGPVSDEIHVFDNVRNPDSPWIKTSNTATSTDAYEFCPSWNIVSCATLSTTDFTGIDFQIFPNPTRNKLTVSGQNLKGLNFNIYDISGRIITKNPTVSGSNEMNIDVSGLSAGTYIIKLNTENKTVSKLFIKK